MKSRRHECDVIVTYCWNRVGYNILRSLANQGLKVWTADTSKHNICSMSKFCSGSFEYPNPFTKEEEFIASLLEKVEELHPKLLLPTHDEGIIVARHRDKFPEWLIIPIEEEQKLLKLSNKKIATQLAAEAGIPIPSIYNKTEEVTSYPVVFKSVIGNSAKDVFFPKSKKELDSLIEKYSGREILLEEYIGGGDVCVDCVRNGNFFQASVYRALVTKTDGGGTTTQREIIEMPQLIEYSKKFLEHVDYNGVCGLDFRVDPEINRIAFIEMNARFTGGLATPIAAGFDIPSIWYNLATAGAYNGFPEARIGTKTKWILGDIITLVGRILSLKLSRAEIKKVFSFSGFDAFDDFRRDDKKAILGEVIYYLSKLIKNCKLNP